MPSGKNYNYDVRIRASLDTSKVSGAGSDVSRQVKNSVDKTNSIYEDSTRKQLQWQDEIADNFYRSRQKMSQADEKFAADQRRKADKWRAEIVSDDSNYAKSVNKRKKLDEDYYNSSRKFAENTAKEAESSRVKQSKASSQLLNDLTKLEKSSISIQKGFANLGSGEAAKGLEAAKTLFSAIRNVSEGLESGALNSKNSKKLVADLKTHATELNNTLRKQQSDAVEINNSGGRSAGAAFIGSFRGALVGMATGMAVGFAMDFVSNVSQRIGAALETGMRFEREINSLNAVSVSAEETASQVENLKQISQNTPGLTFESALLGEQRLRAVGLAAGDATDLVVGLSKQRLMSNGTQEDLDRVVVNLQQIKSTGVASQREIRELLHAMPTLAEAMENAFGTTNAKRIESLGISGSKFIRVLNEELKKTPGIAGDTQDSFEKLQSQWSLAEKAFADQSLESVNILFKDLTVTLKENEQQFAEWGVQFNSFVKFVDYFVGSKSFKGLIDGLQTSLSKATLGASDAAPKIIGGITSTVDWLFSSKKEVQKSAQDAEAEENRKHYKQLNEIFNDSEQDSLSLLKSNLSAKEREMTQHAGFSKESERQLQLDLKTLKIEGLDDQKQIEELYWDAKINFEGNSEDQRRELTERKGKAMNALVREQQEERTKLEREQASIRIQTTLDELQQKYNLTKSFQDAEHQENMSAIQSRNDDTLEQQKENHRLQYEEEKQSLKQRKDLAEKQYIEEYTASPSKERLNAYVVQKRQLDAEEKILDDRRKKELHDDEKAVKDSIKNNSKLQISSGFSDWDSIIKEAAAYQHINPNLLATIHLNEVGHIKTQQGRLNAVSPMGAKGAFQFTDGTAGRFKVNQRDFRSSAFGAADYLRYLLDVFQNEPDQLALAIGGYNAGEGKVESNYSGAVKRLRKLRTSNKENSGYVKRGLERLQGTLNTPEGKEFGLADIGASSDRKTKDEKNKRTLALYDLYTKNGWVLPSNVLNDWSAMQTENERGGGGVQKPDYQRSFEEYQKNRAKSGNVSLNDGFLNPSGMNSIIESRPEINGSLIASILGVDPNYVDKLRAQVIGEGYGTRTDSQVDYRLGKLTTDFHKSDREKNTSDRVALLIREATLQEEISLAVKAQSTARKNESLDLEKEYELLKAQNPLEEKNLEIQRQQNKQTSDIQTAERDLAVLRAQNADNEFVQRRRNLKVQEEQVSLEKELTDLKDQLAVQGENEPLKLEVELTRQVLNFRQAELDAVTSIELSKREISRLDEYSSNRAGAQILQHLAQQKSYTDAVADSFISIYDSINDIAGKGIDKLTAKLGVFKGFASSFLKYGVQSLETKVAMPLLDKLFPGLGTDLNKTQNPVTSRLDEHTKLLQTIAYNTSVSASGGAGGALGTRPRIAGGGGILGSILSGVADISGAGAGVFSGNASAGSPMFSVLPDGSIVNAGVAGTRSRIVGGLGSISTGGGVSNSAVWEVCSARAGSERWLHHLHRLCLFWGCLSVQDLAELQPPVVRLEESAVWRLVLPD